MATLEEMIDAAVERASARAAEERERRRRAQEMAEHKMMSRLREVLGSDLYDALGVTLETHVAPYGVFTYANEEFHINGGSYDDDEPRWHLTNTSHAWRTCIGTDETFREQVLLALSWARGDRLDVDPDDIPF